MFPYITWLIHWNIYHSGPHARLVRQLTRKIARCCCCRTTAVTLPVQKHCCSHAMFHELYTLSAICSVRFPTVAWRAAYDFSYTAADRWFRGEEISSFCRSSWASGPGRLVAVAFSLLWLPRVMLHILHQGPVVQSNCAVGSSYQSSMDHCRPLWSRSRRPINPKKY